MLEALLGIPKLNLIVSEEFTINDPYKLERLKNAELQSVPPDHRKLHAKVLIAKLKDGAYWTLLGSANFTRQGMFSNQEACVVLESSSLEDGPAISEIRSWFTSLHKGAQTPNLVLAKSIFDQRSRYRLEARKRSAATTKTKYWALKTTSGGPSGEEHWPKLLAEGVIAIGWEELAIDPSLATETQLRTSLHAAFHYTDAQVIFAASTIRKFIDLKEGTIVLLCRGYASKQKTDVHIYGFARVTGPFRTDPFRGTGWRFKHDAVIQEIGMSLPRDTIAAALEKDTLRQTMHALNEESINRIAIDLGVRIEV